MFLQWNSFLLTPLQHGRIFKTKKNTYIKRHRGISSPTLSIKQISIQQFNNNIIIWHWKISLTHKCLKYPRKTTITKPICMKTSPIHSAIIPNVSMTKRDITRKSLKSSIISSFAHFSLINNHHLNLWHLSESSSSHGVKMLLDS